MEHLYRVKYNGDILFESNEKKQVDFFVELMQEKKKHIVVERAELVWWPVPPEKFDSGVT